MAIRAGILGLVSALGLPGTAMAQASPPPQILDCTEFSKKTDEAALVKRFGRENVVTAKLDGAEGETVPGTVVYPKDPSRRLEVTWWDTARRRGLSGITLRGRSEWTVRTPGQARDTVGLRTGLAELEEANEKPFRISGFGWDYGGYATSWKGGRLDHMAGGCSLSIRFDPDAKAPEKALAKVTGDREFGSSEPALRAVKPVPSSITVGWPE
ncbi:hypothetical protein SAMN04488125_12166 [Methylorubrum salsuginis]|uniref:Uncharacterized protein n=1 Tax=Methylorubrum salsuginis TaxID=414703 RepID=A0A1I4JTR7_9HYPH|nr:hypothetical protein SAMN04488125_12166 [Methylorubrum salsuginis]